MKRIIYFMLILLASTAGWAQSAKDSKTQPKPAPAVEPTPTKTPDPNFVRWRVYLDTLAQEAKAVAEERRPYVVADLAAAYAEYDRDEALRLFSQALEEAFKFRQQDPNKYDLMLEYVLKMGSQKGSSELSAALVAKLKKLVEADKDNTQVKPYEADRALLEGTGNEDVRRRAELAKSVAPRGLREGTGVMNLVFNLVSDDKGLADDVFATYLQKAAADDTIPVGALFQMQGYAFGYSEYYFFGENSSSTTMGGGSDLKPNPALRQAFASLMLRRITMALDRAEQSGISNSDAGILLVVTKVMSVDAERAIPEMLPAWQQLEQRALIGRTPDQLKSASTRADRILNTRARNSTDAATQGQKMEDEAEAMLADIDKVIGSCQRDIVYSRAAINLMTRNIKRAEEVIDKISDLTRATNLRDIMYERRVEELIGKDDVETGSALIAKITSPSIKGLATANLAQALIKKKALAEGSRTVDDAAKLFDKMNGAPEKAAHLFGLATLLLKVERRDAIDMLEKGIKAFNKADPQDRWRFANTMEVVMSCPDDKGKSTSAWGGSFGESDILQTVTAFAKDDLDGVSSATDGIADKPTRLRAQAIIAKAGLARYKPKQ